MTDETGAYIVPNVPVGLRLEAALPGFMTFVQRGIVLQDNSSPTTPVVHQVEQVSEQVEVASAAAQVETSSPGTAGDFRIMQFALKYIY